MRVSTKTERIATLKRIGVDSSKHYLHVHGVDSGERVVLVKMLRREEFLAWAANIPKCVIGFEACSSSHYWARELSKLGHEVKLMAAEYVSPYRKSRKGKNDATDAEAICEAVGRPNMQFVTVKCEEQQSLLVLHRLRAGLVGERTAQMNRIRGLLAEFGIWIGKTVAKLENRFSKQAEELARLPLLAKTGIEWARAHWKMLDERIAELDRQINQVAKGNEAAGKIQKIIGIGTLTASAVTATIIDGKQFKNGRKFAASIGLVPSQHSTGGKAKLGRITKRGDSYLRHLLVQGARSAFVAARRRKPEKLTRLEKWMLTLNARVGYYKTLVAIANKHARIIWAVLAKGEAFDPKHGESQPT
ncbi:IS110 family transposase [Nitrosomonas sp. Is37]|uniref:IS110 family transposase n=1 Tax=Nitrosomonas sp. Is37 TaxID=3080535 RepID=UPI00294B0C28|nr:IS110 family transposase [Nitrosomonas sp. Is37]MDV6344942.1 IS110 family transposase [Nitrosomonas sp. Is37]